MRHRPTSWCWHGPYRKTLAVPWRLFECAEHCLLKIVFNSLSCTSACVAPPFKRSSLVMCCSCTFAVQAVALAGYQHVGETWTHKLCKASRLTHSRSYGNVFSGIHHAMSLRRKVSSEWCVSLLHARVCWGVLTRCIPYLRERRRQSSAPWERFSALGPASPSHPAGRTHNSDTYRLEPTPPEGVRHKWLVHDTLDRKVTTNFNAEANTPNPIRIISLGESHPASGCLKLLFCGAVTVQWRTFWKLFSYKTGTSGDETLIFQ